MIPFPDLEPILEPPPPGALGGSGPALWWWLLAGIMGLLLLMFIVWALIRWARRLGQPTLPPAAAREALRRLEALRRSPPSDPAMLGAEVSALIRHYLDRCAGVMARYATTPELMGRVRRHRPPPLPVVTCFDAVLEACDRLKFGVPAAGAASELIAAAMAAVEASRAATPPVSAAPVTPPPLPDAPAA